MAGALVLLALGPVGGSRAAGAAESAQLGRLAVEVERLEGARAIKNLQRGRWQGILQLSEPNTAGAWGVGVYEYPSPSILPFHFPNPVTGVPFKEPAL
jgi:hypothetical protein